MQELRIKFPWVTFPVMNVNIRVNSLKCSSRDVDLGWLFVPIHVDFGHSTGLVTDTYLEAMHIAKGKHSYAT